MRRTGCGTGHSRVTELGRHCDAIEASDRGAGRPPGASSRGREVFRGNRGIPGNGEGRAGSLPGLLGRYSDQAAVWLKRSPKVQLVPWSA
jgi:hypothetical protein